MFTKQLYRALALLQQHDKDMTITRAMVLLVIYEAGKDGLLFRDIHKRSGMSRPNVSRTVDYLGDKPQRGQAEGLRLVENRPDPEDPRRSYAVITPKGERLMQQVEAIAS